MAGTGKSSKAAANPPSTRPARRDSADTTFAKILMEVFS